MVDPLTLFRDGDLYRLQIETNSEGYLYVIQQSQGKDGKPIPDGGKLVFPDPRTNSGLSSVAENVQYTIPCSEQKDDCWYRINSSTRREVFMVIFSRDKNTNLTTQAGANNAVKQATIDYFKSLSNQTKSWTIRPALGSQEDGPDRYVTSVNNIKNRSAGEEKELITTIEIINQSPPELPKPAPCPELPKPAPALKLDYKVYRLVKQGNYLEPVDLSTLRAGDLYQLWITPPENGYLYVIRERQGKNEIIFPSLGVYGGQNKVIRGQEYKIPFCDDRNTRNNKSCLLDKSSSSERETITVIFRTNMLTKGAEVVIEALPTSP